MLSEKFKNLSSLLTPEALRQKQGQELTLKEEGKINEAYQEIIDSLTGDNPRHNRAITAILDDFNLPKLNIHGLGQILSLGKDKVYAYGAGGAISGAVGAVGAAATTATGGLTAGSLATAYNYLKAVDTLATVYSTTYETMNQYLNLGDGALQEKARNLQLSIQQAQLRAQAVKDGLAGAKEEILDAGKNLLHWAQNGIGFPGKDGDVDPILIPEPPLPIVGHFNLARLLLANAISGGGASARKALFEAYDVKGEGWLFSDNWDKAVKMVGIAKKYALTSPELTPLLFGDDFKLTPEQLMYETSIMKARLGTYFAPTADETVEMNKISSSVLDSDWGMISKLCTENKIASSISHMCIPIFTKIKDVRMGARQGAKEAYAGLINPYVHPGIEVKDRTGITKEATSGRSVYPNGEFVCPVGFVLHGNSCKMCEDYPNC
jgi:hypothetical protein